MLCATRKKKKIIIINFPTSRSLYMSSSGWENKSIIIRFLSIPTLSQPFNTVSSLFRMYSSIPCGQALLSAGRFFCGTKEEVITIAKNIAMYLKLTNTSGICKHLSRSLESLITTLSQQLNGYIIPTRRLHSLRNHCSNGGVVIVPRFGNRIVFSFECYNRSSLEAIFSESRKRFRNRSWPFLGEWFSYAEGSNEPLSSRAIR